jgi:hypothetical protein
MKGLIPPLPFQSKLQPLADAVGLPVFAQHAHEVAISYALYHIIFEYAAPTLSKALVPSYKNFDFKTTLKWKTQCVSMVQSILICSLSLWVMVNDKERASMNAAERVFGFTGAGATVQAFAMGYFIWDLINAIQYFKYVGLPVLLHAVAAVAVYLLGAVSFLFLGS